MQRLSRHVLHQILHFLSNPELVLPSALQICNWLEKIMLEEYLQQKSATLLLFGFTFETTKTLIEAVILLQRLLSIQQ